MRLVRAASLACGSGARRGHVHVVEPAPLVGRLAGEQAEERSLQRFRDGSALARTDCQAIHRADRSDLDRGAREERLIGNVQQLSRDGALANLDAALARQAQHGVAGESPEQDRKSTRLNSSHDQISYAVFCLKKKKKATDSMIDNTLT